MRQRSSAPARVVTALALACGFLVVAVIVVTSLGGGDGSDGAAGHRSSAAQHADKQHTPKSYVVQSGDTLTSIAHETGVPVAEIVALNPGIDPQILVSGEKLKLR
ncbi:MAG TPA: LysM domain-containing protein [Solirubrobacterales bacterium]|jgi:LysM repeat protein|nr:LysM domain-containing protein [Solirubrobacterales bacterium]